MYKTGFENHLKLGTDKSKMESDDFCLILDIFHPTEASCRNYRGWIHFIPPKVISVYQPLDQGALQKAKLRILSNLELYVYFHALVDRQQI